MCVSQSHEEQPTTADLGRNFTGLQRASEISAPRSNGYGTMLQLRCRAVISPPSVLFVAGQHAHSLHTSLRSTSALSGLRASVASSRSRQRGPRAWASSNASARSAGPSSSRIEISAAQIELLHMACLAFQSSPGLPKAAATTQMNCRLRCYWAMRERPRSRSAARWPCRPVKDRDNIATRVATRIAMTR